VKKTFFPLFLAVVGLFLPLLFAGCEKDPMVPVDPEPSIWVTVSQNTVPKGSSILLKWGSTGLISLTLNNVSVPLEGELNIVVKKDTSFLFAGKTTKGEKVLSEPATVEVLGEIPAPTVTLKSTKMVSWNSPATLSWTTEYGDSVKISPLPSTLSLPVPLNGNCRTDSLKESITFHITVYGKGGVSKDSSFVDVLPPTKEQYLCSGSRKKIKEDIFLEGQIVFSLDTTIKCEQDDRQIFFLDHTARDNFGLILCDGETEHSISWKGWRLSGDTLWGMGEPRLIEVISIDTLRWHFKSSYQLQDGTMVPTKVVQTFVRKN